MNNQLVLDHVILVVGELAPAIRQFNQMGFSVIPGGVHAGGYTHNALVPFIDGTYLELLATTSRTQKNLMILLHRTGLLSLYTSRDTAFDRRFKSDIASGAGFSDYCLLSSNLDVDIPSLELRGLNLEGPIPGSRQRPDGQQVSWRTAIPPTEDLPFLIDDITPRQFRVPDQLPEGHPNQVIGIAGITLGVRDLEESTGRFRSLIAAEPDSTSEFPLPGIQSIEFPLGGARVGFIQPGRALPMMRKTIGRHIARPLIVWLITRSAEPSGLLGLSYMPGKGVTLSRGNPYS